MAAQKVCRFKHSELQKLLQLLPGSDSVLARKINGYMKSNPEKQMGGWAAPTLISDYRSKFTFKDNRNADTKRLVPVEYLPNEG